MQKTSTTGAQHVQRMAAHVSKPKQVNISKLYKFINEKPVR